MTKPHIIYQKWIKRDDLLANPTLLYIFGDNANRIGFGGQAAHMRGEPNAHGIATLWSPGIPFTDRESEDACRIIDADLDALDKKLTVGILGIPDYDGIVFPIDGVGTGLAMMNTFCPSIKDYLDRQLKARFGIINDLQLVRDPSTLPAPLSAGVSDVKT